MLLTNTPYSIAVGEVLMMRMETIAQHSPALNVGSLNPLDMLPHLLGGSHADSPDIWTRTAHDMLVRAQARSKSVAIRLNGSVPTGSNGHDSLSAPDFVRRALDVWAPSSGSTDEQKRLHIAGVKKYLEESLTGALEEARRPSKSISPPRSAASAEIPVAIPPGPMVSSVGTSSGLIPDLTGGGLPFLNSLMDQVQAKPKGARLAYVAGKTKSIPQPFAMATMFGGEKLGSFAVANDSFLDRFKWNGARRDQLLRMSLIEWYHPDDRALFATLSFAIGRMLLGMRPEIKPRPVRGLSGDVVDFWKKHPGATPREEHYIRYQGAGVMGFTIAFGIFTEQPK